MSGVGSVPGLANGNPVVFFDVTIGGHNSGRVKMEVRTATARGHPARPRAPGAARGDPLPSL